MDWSWILVWQVNILVSQVKILVWEVNVLVLQVKILVWQVEVLVLQVKILVCQVMILVLQSKVWVGKWKYCYEWDTAFINWTKQNKPRLFYSRKDHDLTLLKREVNGCTRQMPRFSSTKLFLLKPVNVYCSLCAVKSTKISQRLRRFFGDL